MLTWRHGQHQHCGVEQQRTCCAFDAAIDRVQHGPLVGCHAFEHSCRKSRQSFAYGIRIFGHQ